MTTTLDGVVPHAEPIRNTPIISTPISSGPIHDVLRVCLDYYDLTHQEMVGSSHRKCLVHPRHIAMYLAYRHTGKSSTQIGKVFGDRDHTTILSAIRGVEYDLSFDDRSIREVLELGSILLETEK